MTNEEAIRLIRSNITTECLFCDGVKNFGCNSKCLSLKALDIAIEAIEKQIAKRPLDADITNESGYGKCPTCGERVNTFDNYIFCDCGQKILWE